MMMALFCLIDLGPGQCAGNYQSCRIREYLSITPYKLQNPVDVGHDCFPDLRQLHRAPKPRHPINTLP